MPIDRHFDEIAKAEFCFDVQFRSDGFAVIVFNLAIHFYNSKPISVFYGIESNNIVRIFTRMEAAAAHFDGPIMLKRFTDFILKATALEVFVKPLVGNNLLRH
ncbi:MAG: hypothetical protein CMO04_16245 [Thalassospira sp.]|nr:hypothetical protein [Thalassospira sp.]